MDERAIHVLMQRGVGGRWLVVAYCLSQGQAGAENDQLFFTITLMCSYSNGSNIPIHWFTVRLYAWKTEHHFPQVQKVTGHFFPLLKSKCCELPYLNKTT